MLNLRDFFNDAMVTASNIMNPIWNGQHSNAYTLSNIACQFIDRVRVYDLSKLTDVHPKEYLMYTLFNIQRDNEFNNQHDINLFLERWKQEKDNFEF